MSSIEVHPSRKLHQLTLIRPVDAPVEAAAFESCDALLEAARQMLYARRLLLQAENSENTAPEARELARKREAAWTESWHRSFELTGDGNIICTKARAAGLNAIEREVLVALLLEKLALLDFSARNCGEIVVSLGIMGTRTLDVLRAFDERGRLMTSGLIVCDDHDEELRERAVEADSALVDAVLNNGESREGWLVEKEDELYARLPPLTRAFARLAEAQRQWSYRRSTSSANVARKVERLWRELYRALKAHPQFKLSILLDAVDDDAQERILAILIGRELGHLPADEQLFTGLGLVTAACVEPDVARVRMPELLGFDAELVQGNFIRPAGGSGALLPGEAHELEDIEFELGDESLKILELKKTRRKTPGRDCPREPKLRMEQLVLAPKTMNALKLAASHARHAGVLANDWGLGEAIPYGRSATLLFYGPPGTGKTAAAEALAHELKKPILVADYSQIQNCWVGNTEKNIVRIFSQARVSGAVLFWDEADAMFYDRDSADKSWEVRFVNILLQELEKFEGVCILATNRKVALDPALERRISLKVHFERPNRALRRKIWEVLIPKKMPLADDVNLDECAAAELSGGEIKNVVLNAARIALQRVPPSPLVGEGLGMRAAVHPSPLVGEGLGMRPGEGLVTRAVTQTDFREALRLEVEGKWTGRTGAAGFSVRGED